MASPEEKSIEIMRELDVDYVLIIFGGMIGFSGDDINKFLWMVSNKAHCKTHSSLQVYFNLKENEMQMHITELKMTKFMRELKCRVKTM